MSVLVTGGAGYIGSHTALALLDSGARVVVIDNLSTGHRWAVPPGATFIEGDTGDRALVKDAIERHAVDAIIHFAASVVVPESLTVPLAYYHNNTVKSYALIETAVACGVPHFIFSSSAAVYGLAGDAPVDESAALKPLSPYGASKLMTETMLADAARAHGFGAIALRYFNVAGADPQGRAGQSTTRPTHLIKIACEAAAGKRTHIDVFGTDYPTADGTCVRDYIHVTDLADAHVAALAHLRDGGLSDVFNCGYGRGFSVLEVIDTVKRVSGRNFEVRMVARRPGDPPSLVAATARIRERLKWQPQHESLEVIVRHALDWEERLSQRA